MDITDVTTYRIGAGDNEMTDPATWIDCPVCEDSYDTQEEADACENWHFTEGGMARLPGGGWRAWEDLTEEEYEAAEAML